jgi:hypothetical protein
MRDEFRCHVGTSEQLGLVTHSDVDQRVSYLTKHLEAWFIPNFFAGRTSKVFLNETGVPAGGQSRYLRAMRYQTALAIGNQHRIPNKLMQKKRASKSGAL